MSNPREISHHDEDYAKMKTDRAMGIQDHTALEIKVIELEMQVSKLEDALRFYSDKSEWHGYPWKLNFNSTLVDNDGFYVARKALNLDE